MAVLNSLPLFSPPMYVCTQQASELAHAGAGGFRLDSPLHIREGLKPDLAAKDSLLHRGGVRSVRRIIGFAAAGA
jgi:hypothetical protein